MGLQQNEMLYNSDQTFKQNDMTSTIIIIFNFIYFFILIFIELFQWIDHVLHKNILAESRIRLIK